MANIFDVSGTAEAAAVNLTRLAAALQASPEDLYTWANLMSTKYGVNRTGEGSKQQVDRLRPITPPDPTALTNYDVAQTRNAISTADGNLQKLAYDSVTITVAERGMPSPLAIKKQALQLAEVDLLMHAMISLRRNRNEYVNFKSRETIRGAVCSTVYGSKRADAASVTNTSADNLSVEIVKELKRRLVALQVRPFGGYADSDGMILSGYYPGITDIDGENQLTSDGLWVTFRRYEDDHSTFNTGYVGSVQQISIFRTDTGTTTTVGPVGSTFSASELIVMGQDPTLLEVPDGSSQGFVGEFPCVRSQVGPVEIQKAAEDNFGRDWLCTWFSVEGYSALESITSSDATTLTTRLGGGARGTAATGSSRYAHKAVFATA